MLSTRACRPLCLEYLSWTPAKTLLRNDGWLLHDQCPEPCLFFSRSCFLNSWVARLVPMVPLGTFFFFDFRSHPSFFRHPTYLLVSGGPPWPLLTALPSPCFVFSPTFFVFASNFYFPLRPGFPGPWHNFFFARESVPTSAGSFYFSVAPARVYDRELFDPPSLDSLAQFPIRPGKDIQKSIADSNEFSFYRPRVSRFSLFWLL